MDIMGIKVRICSILYCKRSFCTHNFYITVQFTKFFFYFSYLFILMISMDRLFSMVKHISAKFGFLGPNTLIPGDYKEMSSILADQ